MRYSIVSAVTLTTALVAIVAPALADTNDWVNVNYVVQQSKLASSSRSSTIDAQASIIRGAGTTAKNGPWSVTNSKGVLPPSGDPHDYLSWAPYHWPNCNWCSSGRTHLVHSGDGSGNETSGSDPDDSDGSHLSDHFIPDNSDPYSDEGSARDEEYTGEDAVAIGNTQPQVIQLPASHRRMNRIRRKTLDVSNAPTSSTPSPPPDIPSDSVAALDESDPSVLLPQVPVGGPPPLPTSAPTSILSQPVTSSVTSQTTDRTISGTPAPAQAPAKTSQSSCTPSPTSSLPPSATWTRCPYISRDGQVNPDVRTLNGPGAINSVSQSILYNAIAYALQKSSTYSQNVAYFIDTFFLNPSTKINPNMNFGQVVRGPGPAGQSGTFTGVLDLRGLVKVVNGIMVIKATASQEWTSERDQGMRSWMAQYAGWLTNSEIGKSAASRANNHGTFYVSQVAAAKILAGDNNGAAVVLQNFFSHQFLDQIAASGEQPFEAVRTRPFHYRCFNLEAMITNAKLGDQLGLNLWTAKSKYGATIQTALDFVMATNPKNEDVSEIAPHVASIAAAYGDPKGKYAAFLKKTIANYQTKPFWFYDQTLALSSSPAARTNKRSSRWAREDVKLPAIDTDMIPFECPKVFTAALEVEVDDGVFVTCDELKPLYETSVPLDLDTGKL